MMKGEKECQASITVNPPLEKVLSNMEAYFILSLNEIKRGVLDFIECFMAHCITC